MTGAAGMMIKADTVEANDVWLADRNFASHHFCLRSTVSKPSSSFASMAISSPSHWKNSNLLGPRRAVMCTIEPFN